MCVYSDINVGACMWMYVCVYKSDCIYSFCKRKKEAVGLNKLGGIYKYDATPIYVILG
jgi:hypothetical protein